jgi:thiamine-phosphate pyrophosphorylase
VKRYCITDSIEVVRRAVDLGADMIQIRAKELCARDLMRLVERAVAIAGRRVLVNTRADVAIACGAGGVHLPGNSPITPLRLLEHEASRRVSTRQARVPAPQSGEATFLIGASCHTVGELQRAEGEGADFAVFGPVFESPAKGPAVGVEALRAAVQSVTMPVYALGGVTEENAELCMEAGAYGIAGIRFFLE